MTSIRAIRKERADKKRKDFVSLIYSKLVARIGEKSKAGFSAKAVFYDSLAEANIEIGELIKRFPHDAHLIRQSAYMVKRDLENILNKNDNS